MVKKHTTYSVKNYLNGCHLALWCMFFMIFGCTKKPDNNTLLKSWKLCEALEYQEAFPKIRDYLLYHPRSSVAHYLLGKCYQQQSNPALTLAKGELDMARNLFDTDGDLSILADTMTASQFQSTLHCDTVLVLLRTIIDAEEEGVPENMSTSLLKIAIEHARKAAYFNPKSVFISELTNTLEEMMSARISKKRPKYPVKASPPISPPGKWIT